MQPEREARFASLYEHHHANVAAFCRRRAEADVVEDLIADVFLTVWRKIDQAPTGDEALRWLYRISYLVVTNHWRSSGRKQRLARKLESMSISIGTPVSDQVVMRAELRRVIEAASRLRPTDQEVLRLSLWEHLSHQDIGIVLGIEPNAVKQRIHRARKALMREHDRLLRRSGRSLRSPAAQEGGEW